LPGYVAEIVTERRGYGVTLCLSVCPYVYLQVLVLSVCRLCTVQSSRHNSASVFCLLLWR